MRSRPDKSLPRSWHWVQLREVAGVGAGNPAPQGTRYFEGGDYPFVRTQDVGRVHHDSGLAETTDKVNDIGVAECGLTLWPSRALLVPKSGASTFLNHRVLTAIEAYVSSHLAIVTAGRHVVPEYLYYWSLTLDARLVAPDNNYPSLRLSDLEEVWLPVPPLPVQERIVEILQRADAIRRKRQHALDLAEIILLASFIHMFGDPLENSNGFPTRPLGKLASVRSGVTKGRALGGKETVEAPYLRVANVQDGYLDLSEIKTVRVLPGELEKYRLEVGDVLMTEGGDPDKLGRGSIWHEQIPGCIYQNHVFRVRTDRDQLTPEYLAALLRTRYAKDYFFRCAKRTSNLASINSTQVKGLPVPVAPKDMQDRFVAAVSRWQDLSLRLTATLRTAVSTYQSLLNHAFTGKLTSEWEATRRDAIAAEQALHARLPQLVLLGFLREHARRAAGAAAAAGLWLTGLMKYAFLLQMEGAAKARLYHFVPYHFGPFARDVYTDLEVLREQGLIAVEPHGQENPAYGADNGGLLRVAEAIAPYGSTRPRKVETPRMDITVADTKAVDRTLQDLPVELREDIEAILDAYGDLAHNALLKAVYEKYPTFAKKSKLRGTTNKRRRGRAAAQRNKNSCGAIAETKPLSWVGRW